MLQRRKKYSPPEASIKRTRLNATSKKGEQKGGAQERTIQVFVEDKDAASHAQQCECICQPSFWLKAPQDGDDRISLAHDFPPEPDGGSAFSSPGEYKD